MSMIHPDDENFSKTEPLARQDIRGLFLTRLDLEPIQISSPSSTQGQYHKLYFITLQTDDTKAWSGRQVVLRVARKAFTKIKTENEVAMIKLVRGAGIPVPEIVFHSSDAGSPSNLLGYEYICMERIRHPPLQDTWRTLPPAALDRVLSQLVDIFVRMFEITVPGGGRYGGLMHDAEGRITSGPVLEETMWQIPDIKRYFNDPPYSIPLTLASPSTLNPTASYPSFPAYISAFLATYAHIISIHPSLTHLTHLLPPLHALIRKLDAADAEAETWVRRLRMEERLRGRVWHRDLHFGNMLADEEGNIQAIIDWEFSGIGPSFAKTSDPLRNILYFLQHTSSVPKDKTDEIVSVWPARFFKLLRERSVVVADLWARESSQEDVLGAEGCALSDVREYLRSCIEVGVRGWGNVESGKGAWRKVVETRLQELGCM